MKKLLIMCMGMLSCSAFAESSVTTSASVPMSLEIPKQCNFSNIAALVELPTDSSDAVSEYTVTCNTPYQIYTNSEKWEGGWFSYVSNSQHEQLKTGIKTRAVIDAAEVPLRSPQRLSRTGYAEDTYRLTVSVAAPITAITRAGVYTDTYYIYVDY